MKVQIGTTLRLSTIECAECSIVFGVSEHWDSARREDHRRFFCPNGHPLSYPGETEKEREIRQLKDTVERERRAKLAAMENELVEREARKIAEKKLNRVSAGVCPCCNRSFANLQRHVSTKHPDFVEKGAKARRQRSKKTPA